MDIANIDFADYIIDRFEVSIVTCSCIRNALHEASANSADTLEEYILQLTDLIDCLRHIHQKWEEYETTFQLDHYLTVHLYLIQATILPTD